MQERYEEYGYLMNTLTFYNQNATTFFDGTITADMSDMHQFFLKHLSPKAHILDFGCGSGRDSKAFKEAGYTVEAADGSEELCKLAAEYVGIPVKHMYFQDLQEKNCYDGIWACASILHLTWEELKDVIPKMTDALKENGVIYASFKYGDFEGEKNGRYFTYLTEERLERLLKEIAVETLDVSELLIGETVKTADVRKDREEELWLNVILQKISRNQK